VDKLTAFLFHLHKYEIGSADAQRNEFKGAKVQKILHNSAPRAEKDVVSLVKGQNLHNSYNDSGTQERRLHIHAEIGLQHDHRVEEQPFYHQGEEPRLHPHHPCRKCSGHGSSAPCKKSHYFVIPDLRRMLCIALNAGVFSMPSKPLNLRSASSARSMNLSASLPSNVGIALISIAIIFLSFFHNHIFNNMLHEIAQWQFDGYFI